MSVKVFRKSCENLKDLADNSIGLTVTSPPYWNAIDYDVHSKDSSAWFRTRQYQEGFRDYPEYLAWITRIFQGIYEKTKPGGFACIVIGTVLFQKKHYPVPFDLVSRMTQETSWEFHQDIIWHKVTGGVKRFGVFIQKPYPGYFYPNIMTEYILVFRKPGPPIFENQNAERKAASGVRIQPLYTMEIANTVWHIPPVPPNQLPHPCPFPEEIPHRLIQLYSYEDDLILDPFCGIGTTLKVARALKRNAVGYETLAPYAKLARSRSREPLRLRPGQLVATFRKEPLTTV